MGDRKRTLQIEYDDNSRETNSVLTRFDGTFRSLKFDKKSFFNTLLGFAQYCDYRTTGAIHVDSPVVYASEEIISLKTLDKIHLKCDIFNGSVVSGLRQPTLYSSVLDKPSV